jgi:hypothetical protein
MCWSQQISWGFALVEAISLMCLWRLSNGFTRHARHLQPLLISIWTIELFEACIWPNVDLGGSTHGNCNTTNRFLTWMIFVNLSLQPLLVNIAALHIQPYREVFKVTSFMAAIATLCYLIALMLGEVGEVDLMSFAATRYLGMHGTETCSFLGSYNHLHWVFKISANFMLPNGYTYIFMMLPPLISKPWHLLAAPLGAYLLLFAALFYSMGYSFEAGSVWCWSAIGLHLYAYILCFSLAEKNA